MFSNQMRMTGFSGIDTAEIVQQIMQAHSVRLDRLRQNRDIIRWQQETMRGAGTDIRAFQGRVLGRGSWTSANNVLSEANWRGFNARVETFGVGGAAQPARGVAVTTTTAARPGTFRLDVHQAAQNDIFRTIGNINTGAAAQNPLSFEDTVVTMRETFVLDAYDDPAYFTQIPNFTFDPDEHQDYLPLFIRVDGELVRVENLGELDDVTVYRFTGTGDIDDITDTRDVPTGEHIFSGTFRVALNNSPIQNISFNWAQIAAAMDSIEPDWEDAGLTDEQKDELFREALARVINDHLLDAFGEDTPVPGETPGPGAFQRVTARIDGDGRLIIETNPARGHRATILDGTGANEGTLGRLGYVLPEGHNGVGTALSIATTLSDFLGIDMSTPAPHYYVSFSINDTNFTFGYGDTIQTVLNRVNTSDAGVRMTFNSVTGQFTITGEQLGVDNEILMSDGSGGFLARIMGLGPGDTLADARIQTAQNAVITLGDGISSTTFDQNSNTFTNINGLNITLDPAVIPQGGLDEPIIITLERDLTDTRQMIVDFVEYYNALVRSIRSLTETRRPRSQGSFFMPLTEQQRRGMSDREIAEWEAQARTGILNRDHTLRQITSQLHNAMFSNVELGDGRTINLLHIGIRTDRDLSNFGQLEIDDEALDRALEMRLDDVAALFRRFPTTAERHDDDISDFGRSGIGTRVNDILNRNMSLGGGIWETSGLGDGGLSDVNNTMQRRIDAEERRIDNMIRNLERREQRYFVQFSRMEMAMMQAQSQMMFLDQMLWSSMNQ